MQMSNIKMPTARHKMAGGVLAACHLEIQLFLPFFQELTNDISCWSLCFLFKNHFSFLVQNEAICLFYLLYTCTARSDQLSPCWEDCPKITFSMRLYKTVPLWYSLTTKTNIIGCVLLTKEVKVLLYLAIYTRLLKNLFTYIYFHWFDIYK